MASEAKRSTAAPKAPVALPRSEPETANSLIPRDAVLRAVIGARVRITTAAPNAGTVEGIIFTADPISNFLVICTSSISTPSSSLPPGSYRFIQISTISSFQLLNLPQTTPDPSSPQPTLYLDPSTLDTSALNRRLASTLSKLSTAASRRGPSGTTREAQDIFDSLSRSHPMRWQGSTMIFSDEFSIEEPYQPQNCQMLPGRGSAQGLERLKKVLRMETEKLLLKRSAKAIDGKMAGSIVGKEKEMSSGAVAGLGIAAGSPRKGG